MANDLEEQSEVQQKPKREGRNMIMFLSPRKNPLIKKDSEWDIIIQKLWRMLKCHYGQKK